jgi:hypothetical protein
MLKGACATAPGLIETGIVTAFDCVALNVTVTVVVVPGVRRRRVGSAAMIAGAD